MAAIAWRPPSGEGLRGLWVHKGLSGCEVQSTPGELQGGGNICDICPRCGWAEVRQQERVVWPGPLQRRLGRRVWSTGVSSLSPCFRRAPMGLPFSHLLEQHPVPASHSKDQEEEQAVYDATRFVCVHIGMPSNHSPGLHLRGVWHVIGRWSLALGGAAAGSGECTPSHLPARF